MKALIISPGERPNSSFLAQRAPLVNFPILGKPLIHYWLEFLAAQGAKEIIILATDRPEQVRAEVGDGSRWGLKIEVAPELRELTVREARKKYRKLSDEWLAEPHDVALADTLPGLPGEPLFASYETFVATVAKFQPCVLSKDRIGLRQIMPGVWAGCRSQISASAKLVAPCWIGENVAVGPGATVGPGAIIEDRCFIDANAEVTNSIVAPETFVGKSTTVKDSIALGKVLINWKTDSHAFIEDRFLMCDLKKHGRSIKTASVAGRVAAAAALVLTAPVVLIWALQSWLRGQPFVQQLRAVKPGTDNQTVEYFEFSNCASLLRRWPQLLNVMRGEFAWVGNRPITPAQAQALTSDFEKLWLAAPVGLVSQADAAGCVSGFSDEARAHSSFYAAQANWRLNFSILLQVMRKFPKLRQSTPISLPRAAVNAKPLSLSDSVLR